MLRHEFRPGRLVAGLVLLGAGVAYALDAAGAWAMPAWAPVPGIVGGLCLAALTTTLASRRRDGGRGLPPSRPGPARGGTPGPAPGATEPPGGAP